MDDKKNSMTYIEGRTIFRNELISLLDINEIDFYFKTVLQSIFNIEQTALALSPTKLFNENQKRELEKVLKHACVQISSAFLHRKLSCSLSVKIEEPKVKIISILIF